MKIKKWEIYIAIVLAIFVGAYIFVDSISKEQNELSDKLIRMHVVANSDSSDDQELKLEVRDSVNKYLEKHIKDCNEKCSAEDAIKIHLNEIKNVAQNTICGNGYDYNVNVSLTDEYFPTREYDNFSLPAGKYTSLRITIGEGNGKNWWCVVFPPLCTSAVTDETLTELAFTEEEIKFITSDDTNVIFKFKILELINIIKTSLK